MLRRKSPEPLTYVRPASEVMSAARFDVEFFTPRTPRRLAKLSSGEPSIRDVATPRHENFTGAGGPGEFNYIEIGAWRGDGTVGGERLPCAEAPSPATWIVRAGDVVTFTVRPNRRLSALITPTQDGFVASSGFVVLQPKTVSAAVQLTHLRLPPVREIMACTPARASTPRSPKRTWSSSHSRSSTPGPAARALLARAQRAVELAIGQGEAPALALLTS